MDILLWLVPSGVVLVVMMAWAAWAGRPRREETDRSEAAYERFARAIAKEHPASIAIDMDDLALVDSSCVAVLVEAWRFADEHGIALRVKSPAASIRQVFDVADSGLLLTLRH